MQALTTTVCDLSPLDAVLIRTWLTKPGSEFQAEVTDATSDTPIAIVRSQEEWVAAWTATHNWRGMQTLEGFTHPSCRRRGFARVAAAMLIAEGHIDPSKTLAVFSPLCVTMAAALSCRDVRLYERRGTEWVQNS
jgi:hypothetical protein